MGGKNIVGSFSYNVKDMDIINKAEELAKRDGISFSQLIVELLDREITVRKKEVGQEYNPIGVSYTDNDSTISPKKTWRQELLSEHITEMEWQNKIIQMNNLQTLGQIQGYHTRVAHKCKVRINQLKRLTFQ